MKIIPSLISLGLALGVSTSGCAADDDADFARQAASTGLLEVELGNYAAMNAEDPGVKRFGRSMADDHGKANQELELLAQREGIRLHSDMTPQQREEAIRLMALHGAEFDAAYMQAMVAGHEQAVAAFDVQAKQYRSEIDRWAADTLPRLRQHLEHARELDRGGSSAL